MSRFLFSLLLTTFLCTCVLAQNNPPASYTPRSQAAVLGLQDAQVLDQMMFYIPGIGSASREDLLRQNIKSYMMPIRQVPDLNMEWAYALTGALEYYLNLNNNFKDNLSPDYISLNLAALGRRPTVEDGLRFLVQNGTVSAAIVPYGSPTIPPAVYSVPRHDITNFGYLFRPETRPRNRVFEVRKALSRGNPVVVELKTDPGFVNLRGGEYKPAANTTETHYLTVVGYDGEAEMFELRGSFGRLWADAGYVRLSYDDFGTLAQNGFVLIPK
ncbi:C1 family peptidase [Lewinella sp. W8]|uniref:C1 family peptidase n=1 Tax=Lewinella sp. W8 TaxID=2528208 RepID=UPI001566F362|nr:C1 family peptidase [Lewinella sp. W8]